mgnify:CR=1 FL=1
MNKKSPNVIFKSKYCLALNCIDNKNNSLNYKEDRLKDVDDMIDYFSNAKKKVVGMFEYYMGHTRGENVNLVLENGKYATKQDIKRVKEDYKKYIEKSNLWKGIISFKPEYLTENISIHDLEQKMAKEIMPQFLKYCGFKDIKNMSYVFSIHTNKKHPHIHISFIEKKPNYLYCDKKVNYRRKGKITIDEQRYLKRLIELSIEREKYYTPLLKKTNEDIDYLKSYFNPSEKNFILKNVEEIFIEEKIMKLGELVKEYRSINNQSSNKIKYNSIKNNELGKEIKSLTKEIKKYLLNDDTSLLCDCRKEIKEDLDKLNKYFEKLDNENNIESNIKNNSIVNKKEEYIDNYILNSIVNHALYKYNHISSIVKNKNNLDHITIEDLIQEIAYQNSKKENRIDKERRKQVLDNYFKGNNSMLKFPSKYRMEKAIKNINYEMEKASQEFSKLFNYSSEK